MADQVLENREDVLAILNDAFENGAELRLALGFAIPLRKHSRWDANVAAQFIGRVSTQKEAVEECGFPLRELEVLQRFVERIGRGRHGRKPQFTDFSAGVKSLRYLSGNIYLVRPADWTLLPARKLQGVAETLAARRRNIMEGSDRCE